jgi:hypothetical protein
MFSSDSDPQGQLDSLFKEYVETGILPSLNTLTHDYELDTLAQYIVNSRCFDFTVTAKDSSDIERAVLYAHLMVRADRSNDATRLYAWIVSESAGLAARDATYDPSIEDWYSTLRRAIVRGGGKECADRLAAELEAFVEVRRRGASLGVEEQERLKTMQTTFMKWLEPVLDAEIGKRKAAISFMDKRDEQKLTRLNKTLSNHDIAVYTYSKLSGAFIDTSDGELLRRAVDGAIFVAELVSVYKTGASFISLSDRPIKTPTGWVYKAIHEAARVAYGASPVSLDVSKSAQTTAADAYLAGRGGSTASDSPLVAPKPQYLYLSMGCKFLKRVGVDGYYTQMTTGFAADLWWCYAASEGEALKEVMLIRECKWCPALRSFLQAECG